MNRRELGALIFKIAALYLLLQAFINLNQFLAMIVMSMMTPGNISALGYAVFSGLPVILLILGAAYLKNHSDEMAIRFFGSEGEGTAVFAVTQKDVFALTLSVMGIYLCAQALPRLFNYFAALFMQYRASRLPGRNAYSMNDAYYRTILGDFIQIAIGSWLFFGRRGVADLWHRTRAATPYPTESGDTPADSSKE